jgi:hypothetical protein
LLELKVLIKGITMGFTTKPDYVGTVSWEPIKSEGGPRGLVRAPIVGGWLVAFNSNPTVSGGFTFVPDPNHEWDGNSIDLPSE